jgi:tetratricopeptide (TPR) repeat protein
MSDLEKAIDFINRADIAGFFNFLDEKESNSFFYNNLKKEFMLGKDDVSFHERCKVFARNFFGENKIQTKFLTDLRRDRTFQFVGRRDDLQKIQVRLAGEIPVVLVNGLGGEGKTTLAREYAYENQKDYDYILWLEQISSLRSAFADNTELTADLGFRQEPLEERFRCVMLKLQNLKGNNLLVIDNYNALPEEADILHEWRTSERLSHWKMLITSREQVAGFENAQINLESLSETDAIALFQVHCKKNVDTQELKELLALVDYHALTVELLAKNYQKSRKFNSIQEVTNLLQAKSLDDTLLQELIQVSRNAGLPEKTKVYDYLLKIFAIEPLQEDEIFVLKQFAVLPPLPIEGKDFLEWIQDSVQKYGTVLDSLAEKGWLAYQPENDTFKMHRLVQMVLLKRLKPSFEECERLFKSFIFFFNSEKIRANPLQSMWLLPFGECLTTNTQFSIQLIKKTMLEIRLGILCEVAGKYEKAEHFYNSALSGYEEAVGVENIDFAAMLSNLGKIYWEQGKYHEAEKCYKKAMNIWDCITDKKHFQYGALLNNIGSLNFGLNGYDDALSFFEKSLEIYNNTNPIYYATTLSNIANIHYEKAEYDIAQQKNEEALQIRVKNLEYKHPDVAISLNNLASTFYAQRKYIESALLHEESLKIRQELFGEMHWECAYSLHGLGCIFYDLGIHDEAKSKFQEASSIFSVFFQKNHYMFKACEEYLDAIEKHSKAKQSSGN